jgi:hypothetical protein
MQRLGELTGAAHRPTQDDETLTTSPAELFCGKRLRRILVAQLNGEELPMGRFLPEPWPTSLPAHKKPKPPSPEQPLSQAAASSAQEAA